jgi:hypothetical protein
MEPPNSLKQGNGPWQKRFEGFKRAIDPDFIGEFQHNGQSGLRRAAVLEFPAVRCPSSTKNSLEAGCVAR